MARRWDRSLMAHNDITIRLAGADDAHALSRLAVLDSARAPAGDVLVAELRGELLAALPLDGGRAIADPFHPTADLVALLELRARRTVTRPVRRPLIAIRRSR